MENPYQSSTADDQQPYDGRFPWIAVVLGSLFAISVIANYSTSSTLNLELHTAMMHTVFLVSPFAIAGIAAMNLKRSLASGRILLVVAGITVVLSFAISWLPWFSKNPFEGFVLNNWYFGPYGWMQWTWFVFTGVMPAVYVFRCVGNHAVLNGLLATTIALCHIHNGYYVWQLCHGRT